MPAIKPLIYTLEEDGVVGSIVLGDKASRSGFGAILQQEDPESRRCAVRNASGLWTPAETLYDTVKLECRDLLRALKKFGYYLYGVQLSIEIDARKLVHQLNPPLSDLKEAIVRRWLAYIRLCSFDIKHVVGVKDTQPYLRLVALPRHEGRVDTAGRMRRRGGAEVGIHCGWITRRYAGECRGGGRLYGIL